MRSALLGEGASDRVLLPVLRWLLAELTPAEVRVDWLDPRLFAGARGLAGRIRRALDVHGSDLLFVHRDADRAGLEARRDEIARAWEAGAGEGARHVPVVPVRMTEAWLLLDEAAIRAAAGRPRGREPLDLPAPKRLEALADPKRRLHEAIEQARGEVGRRARRFRVEAAVHRVAELVDDWAALRVLPAFRCLEADTRAALAGAGMPLRAPPPGPGAGRR